MAGSKILKEEEKVSSIRGAIAKAKNNSSCREVYFQPKNIKVMRFKIHESCNRCVYVTVSECKGYSGRFGRGQGKTDLTAGFRREGRDLERRSPDGFRQRRN